MPGIDRRILMSIILIIKIITGKMLRREAANTVIAIPSVRLISKAVGKTIVCAY